MIERVFATISLTLMAASLGLLGYWEFIDGVAPPMTINASSMDKTVYHPGDVMHVTRDLCWNVAASYTLHRVFIDHLVYALPDYAVTAPQVGCAAAGIAVQIPESLPPGEYTYRVSADFRINPIKSVRFMYPDLVLTVVGP